MQDLRGNLVRQCSMMLGLIGATSVVNAQNPVRPNQPADSTRAIATVAAVQAMKLTTSSPRIDGKIDDAVWSNAHWVTQFTQREPVEGGSPSVRTEVAFAYDDAALYVAARM
ncbi:MAG: hypothetical protein ABI556_02325, partial [Gemmatimonadales bacterium]